MAKPIRVGIIGASADGGWAREGHVPAVQALAGMEFVAVATNSQKTAEASARAFGVPAAYGSGMDLIRAPGIDLVTVATRVPDHRELVLAALAAGKHVYSEWPLGAGMAETDEMAQAASAAGVHTAIGLQLRGSPVVRRARELIVSGAVGRVLSVSVYSATAGFGPTVPEPYLYLEAPGNFANLITIQGAHTVDLAIMVAGGRPPETPFRLEVVGEVGVLRLDGGAARGFQSGRLRLSLGGVPQHVDEGELAAMPDAAANVAGVYTALRDDIASGTLTVAGFGHAVKLTRLVCDILSSSLAGSRAKAADWPEQ